MGKSTYLFGDSTPSGLTFDYLAFLSAVVDFSVRLLSTEGRVVQSRAAAKRVRRETESEMSRLLALGEKVNQLLKRELAASPTGSVIRELSEQVAHASESAMQKEMNRVEQELHSTINQLNGRQEAERRGHLDNLQRLVVSHVFPKTRDWVSLNYSEGNYLARAMSRSELGLIFTSSLHIAEDSPFAKPLVVNSVMPNLELKVPEVGGLVRKSVKMKTHKLGSQLVLAVTQSEAHTAVRLRASQEYDDAGYDIACDENGGLRVTRVGKGGEPGDAFAPDAEDSKVLREFVNSLGNLANPLAGSKVEVMTAALDGVAIDSHQDPAILVHRLVDEMAPTVIEIAKRSKSGTELVLKRVVGSNRREEIFASKVDLQGRIDELPEDRRLAFAPLGLDVQVPAPPRAMGSATMPVSHVKTTTRLSENAHSGSVPSVVISPELAEEAARAEDK